MSSNFSVTSKPVTLIKNYYNTSTKNQLCNFGTEISKITEEEKSNNTIKYVGAALALAALVTGGIYLCRKGKTKNAEKTVGELVNVADKGKNAEKTANEAAKSTDKIANAVDKGVNAEQQSTKVAGASSKETGVTEEVTAKNANCSTEVMVLKDSNEIKNPTYCDDAIDAEYTLVSDSVNNEARSRIEVIIESPHNATQRQPWQTKTYEEFVAEQEQKFNEALNDDGLNELFQNLEKDARRKKGEPRIDEDGVFDDFWHIGDLDVEEDFFGDIDFF